ncbi:MAG TPA: hypothetical protein VD905_01695 [Flavobacteriales bacterium]|nr:hypothetical protein [Flavobacteriales bacterium]
MAIPGRFILVPVVVSVSFCSVSQDSSDPQKKINEIDEELTRQTTTVSTVLSLSAYMDLHSLTAFREVIKKHAPTGKVKMITDAEPGKRITVKCELIDIKGKPVDGATVYVYQTSDKGWYADTAAHILVNSGDFNHARLFAYVKTDAKGRIEIETIQPKGYPRSDLPAHIHIHVTKGTYSYRVAGELQFDDDERLTPARRKHSQEERYIISKNSGTNERPVYFYNLVEYE